MIHKFLLNSTFHQLLFSIDTELANQTRKCDCSQCGGKLHQAAYPRSPLGLPQSLRGHYQRRLSFCCGNCRKRVTSPSVRFFGRRWYPTPLLVLISALMMGPTARRCAAIKHHLGFTVSKRTWARWRRWWKTCFFQTAFWKQVTGLVPMSSHHAPFPRILLRHFSGLLKERFVSLLQFFAPMTAGSLRAV